MSYLSRLFSFKRSPAPEGAPVSQLASSHSHLPKGPAHSDIATRREMLRVVLRDTLNRHGIPLAWVTGEALVATSGGHEAGVHWRLVIKHWEPRLLTHGIALQSSLIERVMTFDPMAAGWLMGISWQFALEDESACPPMPHPGLWTAGPHEQAAPPAAVAGGLDDVIAGPVLLGDAGTGGDSGGTAKEDLERLLAVRDADFRLHAEGGDATAPFMKTQPMQP